MVAEPAALTRRDQIIEVAASMFSERGYHATSIRELAEGVGMLPGSLYAHISTKEDLLYEIVIRAAAKFLDGLETVVDRRVPARVKLREAMRAHVRVVADDVQAARVFHHEWRVLNGERREEVVRLRDRYEALWDDIVRALPGAVDPKLARLLVLSAANWVYTWYDPAGPLRPEQVADGFTEILLRGLGARGRGRIPSEVRS